MRLLGLVAAVILLFTVSARADDCNNPIGQKAMTDCAAAAYKETDADLNALYQEIKQRLKGDAETTKQLVVAQRAWVKYRDAECAFSSSGVAGGSIYNFIHTECLDRITKSRVADFESYLNCQEGDLSCPVP